MTKSIKETLQYARDLVAKGHTKKPVEVDGAGNITAVCAGTAMAMSMAANGAKAAWNSLQKSMGGIFPQTYNVDHTKEEVLEAFDRAIASEEGRAAA